MHIAAEEPFLRASLLDMADHCEYKVVELREKLLGGRMSGDKLQKFSRTTLDRAGS